MDLTPGCAIELDWRNSLADVPVWVPVRFEGMDPNWKGRGFGTITGVPVPPAGDGWAAQVGTRITFDTQGPFIRMAASA